MNNYRIDPKQQFSKKLARWTSVFWFLFMTWLSVLFLLAPATAQYCVYMGIISTVVMMVNVIAYTRNSIMEKLAFTLLDKTKIELNMSGKSTEKSAEESREEDEDG